MADSSRKVSELPVASNVSGTDRLLVLYNANNSTIQSVRTISISTLISNTIVSNTVPANTLANGIAGTIAYDNGFIYVCAANNNWLRAPLSTF
jgi:hypothetical protein